MTYLLLWVIIIIRIGDWPSGKAADSGSAIGGSNPSSPAKYALSERLLRKSFCFGRIMI